MRGVARRRTDARLLDVSHDLPRGDITAAAFWLRFLLPTFPPAVHCAVVDPGVGTDRAAIAVQAGAHVIVAPDNGLALPPARALASEQTATEPLHTDRTADVSQLAVYRIDGFDPASATFHGRDVFAPAAADLCAMLSARAPTEDDSERVRATLEDASWLTPTDDYTGLQIPEPTPQATDGPGRAVEGVVLAVDDFGNVITNVPGSFLRGHDRVSVDGESVPVVETFASVSTGARLVTVGSHGYVECDVNDGNGAASFGLSPGETVILELDA